MNKSKQNNAPKNLNVEKIREMYLQGYCQSAIARKFRCQLNAVSHHISDLVVPTISMRRKNSKLTERQVNQIRNLFIKQGYPSTTISIMFKVSQSTVLNIAHGIFYRWVPGTVITTGGKIYEIPKDFGVRRPTNQKGMKKSGPNKDTVRRVRSGALIPLAKKYGVAVCTVSRWIRKNKIKVSKT